MKKVLNLSQGYFLSVMLGKSVYGLSRCLAAAINKHETKNQVQKALLLAELQQKKPRRRL